MDRRDRDRSWVESGSEKEPEGGERKGGGKGRGVRFAKRARPVWNLKGRGGCFGCGGEGWEWDSCEDGEGDGAEEGEDEGGGGGDGVVSAGVDVDEEEEE